VNPIFVLLFIFCLTISSAQVPNPEDNLNTSIDSLKSIRLNIDHQLNLLNIELEKIKSSKTVLKYAPVQNASYKAEIGMEAKFKTEPSLLGNVLFTLPPGTVLGVKFDSVSNYLLGEYKGQSGYIHLLYFKSIPKEIQSQIDALKWKEAVKRKHADKEADKAKLIKKWGKQNAARISDGEIWIGMTDGMAEASLGKPKDINRSTFSFGVHEQWVYPYGKYLYFENGKLKSWQD